MVKAKAKKEKPQESAEEFVQRINRKPGKRSGLKHHFVWQKRRH